MHKLILLFACLACFTTRSFGQDDDFLYCFECEESLGFDECIRKGRVVRCAADQEFCHLSLRHGGWGSEPWVEKTCKTRKSCEDNYLQNIASAWNVVTAEDQIQCNENAPSSVCRCCCSGNLCNQNQTSCIVRRQCPQIRKPRRGYMECTNGFKLQSECRFRCQFGSALIGADTLTCSPFGEWSDPVPTCDLVLCAPLVSPAFGSVNCSRRVTRVGTRCQYSCQEGYRLFPPPTMVTCLDDRDGDAVGYWSSYQAECRPLQCPRQRQLRHGRRTCTDRNFIGSRCTFQCERDDGYVLFPPVPTPTVTLTCQTNEQWDRDRPCCTLPCPPFAVMDFLVILDSSSSVGEDNWVRMTNFVASFLSNFTIRDDSTHVAAFRYNRNVDVQNQILFNTFPNNRTALLEAFRAIPYDGSGTNTGRAINYATNTVLQTGNRELARDVVLLITDGASQDRVRIPSFRLRNTDALVFVLPIQAEGHVINMQQIMDIAGPGNSENILTQALEGGFEALDEEFANDITRRLCNQPCYNPLHNHPDDARLP